MAKNTAKKPIDRKQAVQMMQQRKKEKVSFKEYIKGVKLEMKKVVWPTKKELGFYTTVVLVTCAFFAAAFWAIDTGFLAVLKQILGLNI